MKILSKEEIKKLGKTIKLNLDDDFCDRAQKELLSINSLILKMQKIDTSGVEMMNYPFEEENSYLRDDEDVYHIEKEEGLRNSYNKGDFVLVGKLEDKNDI